MDSHNTPQNDISDFKLQISHIDNTTYKVKAISDIILQIAEEFLAEGKGKAVMLFSLGMISCDQIAAYIMSLKSGVEEIKIKTGKDISVDEYDAITSSVPYLNSLPLFIDDTPKLSIAAIRNRAKRVKRNSNLSHFIIADVELIKDLPKNYGSKELDAMAKKIGLSIIAFTYKPITH